MNHTVAYVGALTLALMAGASHGEPYKDWQVQKGVVQVTTKHVDANHMDDYITGIRSSWVIAEEVLKKHGVIDWYLVNVRLDPDSKGANVMFVEHYPSIAMLEPDKARDTAIRDEIRAQLPKEKSDAMVAGYDKYRTHEDDGFWQQVEFPK